MPYERRSKRVRLPYRLRVQALHEGLHVVRVPSRKALSGDEKIVRSSHGQPPPKSCEAMQLRFRLLQPEAHVHLAVHRRRCGEVVARLFALARALVERAETEVAVRDEGAHVARFGERERTTVMCLRTIVVRAAALRRDSPKDVLDPGGKPSIAGR